MVRLLRIDVAIFEDDVLVDAREWTTKGACWRDRNRRIVAGESIILVEMILILGESILSRG